MVCTAAVRQAEELGAQHLLTLNVQVVLKPFEIDDVIAAVARALQDAGSSLSVTTSNETKGDRAETGSTADTSRQEP